MYHFEKEHVPGSLLINIDLLNGLRKKESIMLMLARLSAQMRPLIKEDRFALVGPTTFTADPIMKYLKNRFRVMPTSLEVLSNGTPLPHENLEVYQAIISSPSRHAHPSLVIAGLHSRHFQEQLNFLPRQNNFKHVPDKVGAADKVACYFDLKAKTFTLFENTPPSSSMYS